MSGSLWALLIVGVVLIFLLQILIKPLALITNLVVKSGIGLALIFLFNYLGGMISLTLPFNPASVLIAGFLGIPGLIFLAYLRYLAQ